MGGYAVDPLELQRVDDLLEQAVAHARAELTALRGHMRSLLSRGWSSPAATAFETGWTDWVRGAEELLAALAELSEVVGASGRGYALTEDSVRTSMVVK